MAKRRVSIPLNFGINQTLDKKLTPFGWLNTASNLRIKERGQLGVRNGFSPLDMSTSTGTMVAYDLFEYKNRLCALGDDALNGYPTELFEYIDQNQAAWRSSDPTKARVMLNPFTNLRDVAGIPQLDGGLALMDCALGQGKLCMVYRPESGSNLYTVIIDQDTDQILYAEDVFVLSGTNSDIKVIYAGTHFLVAILKLDGSVKVLKYNPAADTAWSVHIANAAAAGATITAWDYTPLGHGTTGETIFSFDRGATSDLSILVFSSAGAQVGSTINLATTDTVWISIEGDQTDNTINLLTVENTDDLRLRTFNFAGTLLDGPTTITGGALSGSICRLQPMGSFVKSVGMVFNQSTIESVAFQVRSITGHVSAGGFLPCDQARLRSRVYPAQSPGQPIGLVWAGLVAPGLPSFDNATNAIFYMNYDVAHSTKRDLARAVDHNFTNISFDSTTGKLCWPALLDPGVDSLGVPSVVLMDFRSTDRRQGVKFGNHYYMSGGTPAVYDGRILSDLGFNEIPGVIEVISDFQPDGELTTGATYFYTVHWEYVHADKSLMLSPVSVGGNDGESFTSAASIVIAPGDNSAVVRITVPHHILCRVGDVMLGADVVAVISRTVWSPELNAPFSEFRRCVVKNITRGSGSYGNDVSVQDLVSDVDLSTQEVIYTEGSRGVLSGPLEQDAPRSCSYITASESRLLLGGLINSAEVEISRASFLSETYSFTDISQFFNRVNEEVLAVQSLDSAKLIFTSKDIFALFGDGPDDLGNGALSEPTELSSQGGLIDDGWRSLLRTESGLFYHHSKNRLMLLPRGAQSPVDVGEPVQEFLNVFSHITGTTRVKNDFVAVFSCNTPEDDDSRLLTLDFHQNQWLIDSPPLESGVGIEAVVEFDSKLAYLTGGVVYFQRDDFADNGTDFISTELITQSVYPFGIGGKGLIYDFMYVGQFESDSTLTISVSYDDGLTFVPMESVAETGTAGRTIKEKYTPATQMFSSVVFKVDVTGVTPGEGIIHNYIEMWVEDEPGLELLDPANNHSNA